jgi:hypothetical protein
MKQIHPFSLIAAAILLSASPAFADDSLIITFPGETFVNTAGIAGAPANQTVGTAFAIKIFATTDNVNYILDTAFSGLKTVTYTGPSGGVLYVMNVTFSGGSNTTALNTIITNAQTTTISATAAGAMTPVPSSSLQVNPKLVVTLPGQTFSAGTGNSGTASGQTAGVPFNISSFTAVNADNTIDTALTGDQTVSYSGSGNSPNATAPTYTTSVNFANGISTTALTTTLFKAETTTISAGIAGVATAVASSSLKVAVNPTATQMAFTTQTGGGKPGVAWNVQPTVTLQDTYGNGPVTNVAQNVHLAIQNNPAGGTLSGTTTVAVNMNTGVATFSGLSINNVGANYTLTATGDTLDTTPGTVVSAPFSIRIPTSYDTLILSDSPYAYWPLQDASGPIITDIAGTNNGTLMTSTDVGFTAHQHNLFAASSSSSDGLSFALGAPGFMYGVSNDAAIYFTNLDSPGFSSTNAQIVVPYNPVMDVMSNFTVEAWVNLPNYPIGYSSSNTVSQVILGMEANAGSQAGWFLLENTDGSPTNTVGRINPNLAHSTHSGWTSSSALTTHSNLMGQWVHAVMTYDVASYKSYIDGVLAEAIPNPTYGNMGANGGSYTHPTAFVIGSYCANYFGINNSGGVAAYGWGRGSFFHGGVSHVAVYTNVLTAAQILNHYYIATLGGSQPPTIGTQPVGGTNYIGYSRTLAVAAGGTTPLHYQWSKNAAPIPGATNASLVLANLVLTNTGNYSVTITNGLGSTNSATVTVTVLPLPSDPYQAAIISAFPSAFYPLHETNGPVANDLIDPVNNNGTYVTQDTNTPALFSQPGASSYLGTAVTLNSIATNGIFVNNASAMGIVGALTLEAWVKIQDTSDEQWIVAHGPYIDANPSKTDDRLAIKDGNYFAGWYSDKPTPTDFGVTLAIPDAPGTWVHLVGVADGTYWRLYENGVDVADLLDTNTPSGAIPANGGWAIGGRWDPSLGVIYPSLNGSINNVAIYDHALSPATIQQHYQIGLTGAATPPSMSIQKSGANVSVSWTAGFLQTATSITGPWTYADTNTVTSPYTVGATNAAKFYRATLTPP